MDTYRTVTRERGVTTIPARLRQRAAVEANTELTFVELEPQLWLVGPTARHPEEAAITVAAALRSGELSAFPKLLHRVLAEEAPPQTAIRRYRPFQTPELTEEQMVAVGTPASKTSRRHRGRE